MQVAVLGDVGVQEVVVSVIAGVCGAGKTHASGAGGAEPPPPRADMAAKRCHACPPHTPVLLPLLDP